MCFAGSNFIAYELTDQTVSVYGFDENAPPITNVPVATCVTAHTLPTGETIILVLHQALFLGKKHKGSLLCPNQMRQHRVRVDDCPKHLSLGMNSTHSLHFPEEDVQIPLDLDGTISYFETHIPSQKELTECRHITLTLPEEWDPKSDDFAIEDLPCFSRIASRYVYHHCE